MRARNWLQPRTRWPTTQHSHSARCSEKSNPVRPRERLCSWRSLVPVRSPNATVRPSVDRAVGRRLCAAMAAREELWAMFRYEPISSRPCVGSFELTDSLLRRLFAALGDKTTLFGLRFIAADRRNESVGLTDARRQTFQRL